MVHHPLTNQPPGHLYEFFAYVVLQVEGRVLLISELSTVGRDLATLLFWLMDFWHCLVVPEVEYVEW